ncbi:MAG: glycosyltransferase family 39 protein [Anaerolineae bacterium]|nr:glycosyltransferase family 39 protein [Anaerolineae bacterium]
MKPLPARSTKQPAPAPVESIAALMLLPIVLAFGVWLRFQHFGAIEYNIDQAYPVWQALQTLDTGALPLAGQGTSVLFANPPLTGYLLVPALAIARQPAAAYLFTLALNTLALPLSYSALRRLIGARAALVGAALLAASPWIVENSRRTWVQSLAPFFVCLIFWALVPVLLGAERRPGRRLLIALIGLALFAHTYLLAYALIAPVAVLLLIYRRRVPLRALLGGVAIFAALAIPYGAGLARNWEQTRNRVDTFAAGGAALSDEALGHALRLVTGAGYATQRGTLAPIRDAALRADLSRITGALWNAAILAGSALAVWTLLRRSRTSERQRDAAIILLVWFGLPALLMSYVSQVVHPFYLLLTIPAGHGLAAWGIAPLLRRPATRALVAGLVIGTGALNAVNTVRFAQQSAARPGEDAPYLFPLAESTQIGERLREHRTPGMAVISPMDEWTPVTLAGEVFRVERLEDFAAAALVPAQGALYFDAAAPDDPPLGPPPYAQPAGAALALVDGTLLAWWTLAPNDLVIDHPADIPSDIGVRFIGWTLRGDPVPGATVTLDTFWQVEALHAGRGTWAFAPFAHLFGADGARLAIADGNVIPALDWAAGDILVQRHLITIPAGAAGPFAFDVGLFDAVRPRADGTPGVNAIFYVAGGGETHFTSVLRLEP